MQPDIKNSPPTAQSAEGGSAGKDFEAGWLKRAQAAFQSSTNYLDNNLRKGWDDSLRAFNSTHPNDSKYNSPAYEKRSRLYRPKMRAIIRKNEAAAAAAFFSNMEVVDIAAGDQDNKLQLAGSEIMKVLLQYRLTKSIPWFLTVLGGLQDAQAVGTVCAHVFWEYKAKPGKAEDPGEVAEVEPEEENEYPKQAQLPEGAIVVEKQEDEPEESHRLIPTAGNFGGAPNTAPQFGAAPTPLPAAGAPQQAASTLPQPMGAAPVPGQPPTAAPAPEPIPQMVKGNDALVDRPVVDLIPVENLRIDPSADWKDPINTSPYVIHMIPMYVMDVKSKMESGEWKKYGDGLIRSADGKNDSTRASRVKDREDQYGSDGKDLGDYETCWVQRHIHRQDDVDWTFYTLGDLVLLSEPKPLKDSVFHGKRPYVMGNCMIETHKVYSSSLSQIAKGLTDEANEVANQRIDNVKFVLNKKWFVKRGKEVDIMGLVRNVPGGVVAMDDPINDVREISWPDVTSSAYEEQTRIDNDLSELLGNFSPAQVMADHGIQGPARNMAMLSQSAGTLVEYLLRTYVETFVQPVLRQIVMLEQAYETDQVILALAAKKSKTFQRFNMDSITDEILEQELTLTVNVGMGATDPGTKLQKFMTGVTSYANIVKMAPPGLNLQEVGKEVFGHLGYADGARFFTTDNPQVALLQQQLQQMQQMVKQLQDKANDKMMGHKVKVDTTLHNNQTKVEIAKNHEENENLRASVIHMRALVEGDKTRSHEAVMSGIENKNQRKMGEAK